MMLEGGSRAAAADVDKEGAEEDDNQTGDCLTEMFSKLPPTKPKRIERDENSTAITHIFYFEKMKRE